MSNKRGFGLIETIIAIGIFLVLVSGGAAFALPGLRMIQKGSSLQDAVLFADEGMEAVRSIKKQGWGSPFLSTSCVSGCGVSATSGMWTWSGTTNVSGGMTRSITVLDVSRDGNGDIVSLGGTLDPDTKKITVTVNWSAMGVPKSLSQSVYLAYWEKSSGGPQPTPTPTATGTPTPTPTPTVYMTPTPTPANCMQYCQGKYGTNGVCRKSNVCNAPRINEGRLYECQPPDFCCCGN